VKNRVNQAAVFCIKNALKLTCDHLRVEKISGSYTPGPPTGGDRGGERKMGRIGREGEGREGKEGEEGGGATAPKKCLSVLAPDRKPQIPVHKW
jgi:hypothetical protein